MSAASAIDPDDAAAVNGERRFENPSDERIVQNLGLVRRFISAVFDDPSLTDDIPEGASVVLLPEDDPELAAANRRGGLAMQAAGKTVRFVDLPAKHVAD